MSIVTTTPLARQALKERHEPGYCLPQPSGSALVNTNSCRAAKSAPTLACMTSAESLMMVPRRNPSRHENRPMSDPVFTYDVFLSHSAKDKAVVRPLADRLRADGLYRKEDLEFQPSAFILNSSLAQFLCANWLSAECEHARTTA